MIDMNPNLIAAYETYNNPYVPERTLYTSGEKDETTLINKYGCPDKNAPVLAIKEDIVNDEGYGLKSGFYNVTPDKYLDFLLIYQGGILKAKVPVIKTEIHASAAPKKQKRKKMSAAAYRRYQKKQMKKYQKGINPETIDYKTVEMEYIKGTNSYIIIYNANNIELVGMLKF